MCKVSFYMYNFYPNKSNQIKWNTISDPGQITDNFCNLFASVGPTYANKIDADADETPTDADETLNVIKSLKPKSSCKQR